MPLFSFDCSKCGAQVQKALVTHQRWMDCPRCGAMMRRQEYTKQSSYLDDQKSREEYNMEKIKEREWQKNNMRK